MRVLLLKAQAEFSEHVRYSGGMHIFRCIAETLAEAGHDVHVLYCASKAQLLFAAMQNGCMPQLTYSQAVEGVALWQQGCVTHHVALTDAEQSVADQLSNAFASMGPAAGTGAAAGPVLPSVMQRLMDEARQLTQCSSSSKRGGNDSSTAHQQQQERCWVIIDADGSQEPLAPGCASLFEAAVHLNAPTGSTHSGNSSSSSSSRVLLLVQNVHFLPLGDQGTAARSPGILAAWAAVASVACVSSFVAHYVAQHAASLGLQPQRIRVVHCAAWRAFGRGPFENCGAAHAVNLPWQGLVPGSAISSSDQQQQQQQQRKPIVGCLKVTPEKGGWLFLALAARMPAVNFLGVCADSALLQAAAAAGLPNLRLVPPVADVGQLLQHMVLVLAPSVWQEAFGMVVTEALVRGVPVIVSDRGGLAEAAMGQAAAVVPVQPMLLPPPPPPQQQMYNAAAGCASVESMHVWQQRVFPEQSPAVVDAWAAAVAEVLSSRQRYEAASRAGRTAAVGLLEKQPQLLLAFLEWLQQL